jgi:uncharacterized coiled-coil protein SlyX
MATLEERMAYLEGRGQEQAAAIGEVRADIRDVRADIRDVRTELRDFRVEVNRRFDQMDATFDSKFTWMIGFQFATLMAVIAALLNVYLR